MKKRILAYSVGRSDFDRIFPILNELNKRKKVILKLAISSIHSLNFFGNTVKEIKKKKLKIIINNTFKNRKSFSEFFLSNEINFLINVIKKFKPNLLLVLGDRYEMLAAPCAAITFNLPVVHFYGGAVTEGAIDDSIRHAITKLSHFHFVAAKDYKKRVIQLGEDPKRVKNIGVPELKYLKSRKILSLDKLYKRLNIDLKKNTLLVNFHPVTTDLKNTRKQIRNLLASIKKIKFNTIFTYPNADKNNDIIVDEIKLFLKKENRENKKYIFLKNAGVDIYANLLKYCKVMIGNSSSGIVEAASFNLPTVNIGNRQKGKIFPKNVIQCDYKVQNIIKSVNKALSKDFIKKIKKLKNPYESKFQDKKIAKIIEEFKIDQKTIVKKFYDIQ